MKEATRCPECGEPENGWDESCRICGRTLRIRTARQFAKAMRRVQIKGTP